MTLPRPSCLSHLSHPAIPDITDQSREGGMVYLVLELGGGRTLEAERKLAGGKLPYPRVLGWLMQLGPAISYLHAQHPPIIHRDLKPDNILLDDQGRIMLIDFGIAKRAADGGQTRVIARAATHGFSPPEQAMGTGTDPRSDVYALAATAYALITGTIPTPAHERIAGKALVDPLELVPELPPRIAAALLQALTLNVNQRPASVEQFMHALGLAVVPAGDFAATTRTVMVGDAATLAAAAQATSVRIRSERVTVAPSAPVVSRGHRIGSWVAGALILLTLSAGGAWFFLRQPAGPAPAPAVSPSAIAPVQPHGPGQALSTGASPGANSTPRAQVPGTRPAGPLVGGARAQPNLANATPTPGPLQEQQAERPPSGPSATDMLERFRSEQAATRAPAGQPATKTPAAEPPVRVEATVAVRAPPRLPPRPPPRPPPRRSPPAPTKPTGGTSATSWGWKKGGSHQTD